MDLVDLKVRTIHGAYHTLPIPFQISMPWELLKDDLKYGHMESFSSLVRMKELSFNATDRRNMEYVASVAECTCSMDLIQLISDHYLNSRI